MEKTKDNVKDIIINKVIELIEKKQKLPWVKPWYIPDSRNLLSKTGAVYHGINVWITSFADSPFFIGDKDVNEFKIKRKKGSTYYPIVKYAPFIKLHGKKIEEEEYRTMSKDQKKQCSYRSFLRYYKVWNLLDLEEDTLPDLIKKRIKKYTPENKHNPKIDIAESMLLKHNPIIENGMAAYYEPGKDKITMPKIETFKDSQSYYAVMFHEIAHWTGHGTRLNRKGITDHIMFKSHKYSLEELIAEFSASQICRNLEIDIDIDNSTAYIANWVKSLKNDPDMLFNASKQADAVIEYLSK